MPSDFLLTDFRCYLSDYSSRHANCFRGCRRQQLAFGVACFTRTTFGDTMPTTTAFKSNRSAAPLTHQHAHAIQAYGTVIPMPLALGTDIRLNSATNLNQLLADTITLRDLYKKSHWQVSGPTFYQLHLLFDKHAGEQTELIDEIAERIMTLGGISVAMAADVADATTIPRPPKGREEAPVQISRLLEAHEIVLLSARAMAKQAAQSGDDGTNDLLVSAVIRTNELQVWFLAEHLVDVPLVRAADVS